MDFVYFQSLIHARQQEIEQTILLADSGTQTVQLDQSTVGRLSRMDALQMQQMNLESNRRRHQELLRLQHALKRIEDKSYGVCVECDQAINPKRLEIDLSALRCINCASGHSESLQ